MLRQDIPFEIWWRIGIQLEVLDLINLCQAEPYFTSLFQDYLFHDFKEKDTCPWYEAKMTLGGMRRYLTPSNPLEIVEMTVAPCNTPLPDDFNCFLGGNMITYRRSMYQCYLEPKNLVTMGFNDRGLQVQDHNYGTKRVYLTESRLAWDKGADSRFQEPITVGEYKFKGLPENQRLHFYMNKDSLAVDVVLRENEVWSTQFYFSKVSDLKQVNHRSEMQRMDIDKGCIKSFLVGPNLFSYSVNSKHMFYVNQELQLEMPNELVTKQHYHYLYHAGVYRGKFYYFKDKEFFELRCYKGAVGEATSLGLIPWCQSLEQDDRHPRYLVCEADSKPVGVVDLETLTVYRFPTEDQWYQTLYLSGLSGGELKCYRYTHDFLRTRWQATAYKEEDLHTSLVTGEYVRRG